jgi:arylsulfatase A-like enzyme
VPVRHEIDGASILPTLLGQNQPVVTRDLFWMRREGGAKYQGQDYYAVRRGDWKLVHNSPFEPLQLFNLAADPLEQHDLARQETKVFQDLAAALRAQLQRAGAVPWQKTAPRAKRMIK